MVYDIYQTLPGLQLPTCFWNSLEFNWTSLGHQLFLFRKEFSLGSTLN